MPFSLQKMGHKGTGPSGIQLGEIDTERIKKRIYWFRKLTQFIEDSVCIFPGCYSPTVLWPGDSGQFQVIGEAYVHGLEDAIGILGPLPSDWRAIINCDAVGRPLHRCLNVRTFEQTAEDPQLGPLPPEWKRGAYESWPIVYKGNHQL